VTLVKNVTVLRTALPFVMIALIASGGIVAAQTTPMPGVDPAIVKLLAEIKAKDKGQLAVSEEDGRFMRLMVATRGARRALEIGGASGYSAIWIGMGLRATGGQLVTIEYDPVRAKELAANIKRAGLSDTVQVVSGDAFEQIPKVAGTFDFVFLDAWKKDYKRFFDMVYPRLDARGIFLAHNVVNKRNEMGDFLDAVLKHPNLWTTIVSPSGEGMSVSMRMK
jgi:predicted O-methyltransferase YrrM